MPRLACTAVLLAVLTGCSGPSAPAGGAAAGSPEPRQTGAVALAATLVSPIDIELSWTGTPREAASAIVEFATEPAGRYTILEFVPTGRTTFRHPDLMPRTPFYYQVTPVLGPVSAALDVNLAKGGGRTAPGASAVRKVPVREAAAAPTGLRVVPLKDDGARVTWSDNAEGEEGYLLEIRSQGQSSYRVAGFIDPDATSVELTTLPAERKASYRVRAFYRGTPSNLAHQTTGAA
ncbi:hypothetical protein [Kribbella deserti]|uniref:Fibronectin type-III domain-containing protein n=1 Tax=Kribbella deserti TaxID=1926257 RepID=A0ABV6QIY9_9ACTN